MPILFSLKSLFSYSQEFYPWIVQNMLCVIQICIQSHSQQLLPLSDREPSVCYFEHVDEIQLLVREELHWRPAVHD